MFRKPLAVLISMAFAMSLAASPNTASSQTNLSAAEIVEKNVAARGGLQAWRSVQTISMTGKMAVGGNQRAATPVPMANHKSVQQVVPKRPAEEVMLPFVMDMERTRKKRFELLFNGQTAVQVYDGSDGWKLRPYLNRLTVEPYTAEELKKASTDADLDGPLVDYAAKGTKIELDGTERVEGRNTYKLKLTLKTGDVFHVWVDAQTFLEAKIEGQPRQFDGAMHPVEVYYRDYRPVSGLQIPFVLETQLLPLPQAGTGAKAPPAPPEKTVIEKVVVNPKLDEGLFKKPVVTEAPKAPAPVIIK